MFARRGRSRRHAGRAIVAELTVARRIAALADAAARFADADYPPRVRATRALVERTGYTEPVVDYALDALFGAIDAETLATTIAGDLGSLRALDAFVARPGRPGVRYVPVARAVILSSETTIGVALAPLVFALAAGCCVTVKDRSDGFIAAFAETLAQEDPGLATRVDAHAWSGADAVASASVRDADTVVAFGSTATLAAIGQQLAPRTRFIAHGHRTSIGYVAREALAGETARAAALGAARDALLYDGEGCLSLHALFVERDGATSPRAFARMLADACDTTAVEFPAGYAADDAVAAYRRAALFRATQGRGDVHGGLLTPHVVAFDPPPDEPPPFLRRVLAVYPVPGPDDTLAFVRRHALPLEAVAFATTLLRDDVARFAVACGAARVTELGRLQRPPLGGEHGGEQRILPFVRAIYRE